MSAPTPYAALADDLRAPVQAAHQDYLSRRYFSSLNGLRCLCIAAVMWHHSPFANPEGGPRILSRGFVGVDFFFVLSGFLITTLLLREESRTGRIAVGAFYGRRALRILPVYLLLVTLLAIYWIAVKGQSDIAKLPYYYLFLANFLKEHIPLLSVTWSLSVEEQFYFLWPALLVLLPAAARFRTGLLITLIVICLLISLGLADWLGLPRIETEQAIFKLPGASYMAVLWGALTAVLLHQRTGYSWLMAVTGWRGAPLVFFLTLALYLQLSPPMLVGWAALGMDVLMALCLISIVIREDHVLRPVLTFAPVARVGEVSYGIYLYHLIGLHIAHEIGRRVLPDPSQSLWLVTLLFVVISIAMAEVSFRTYERFFLSLKGRMSKAAVAERA